MLLSDQPDLEIEGSLNYLNQMIEVYLTRRKNIFAILGKNNADQDQIESFNSEYFEDENSFSLDEKADNNDQTQLYRLSPQLLKKFSLDDNLCEVT